MQDLSGRKVEEPPCPRCDVIRTVRLRSAKDYFCLHCGHRWPATEAAAEEPEEALESRLLRLFTADELKRLSTYSAAIRAGFYRDW
jgi:hypothetical protein